MNPHAQRILDATKTINDLSLLRQNALRRLALSLGLTDSNPVDAYYVPDAKWFTKNLTPLGPVLCLELKGGLESADVEYHELAMLDGAIIVDSIVVFLVKSNDGPHVVLLDFDRRVSPSEQPADVVSASRAKWGNLMVDFDVDRRWYMGTGASVHVEDDYVNLVDCAPTVVGEHAAFLISGCKEREILVLSLARKVPPR